MALNILIVDDSAVMRRTVLRSLEIGGIPLGLVMQAGDGQEALAVLDEHWVDLALVDVDMPVMSGLDFIAAARRRADSSDLLFIAIASQRGEPRIAELRATGVEFLLKPFRPEALRRRIEALTGVPHGDGKAGEPAVRHGDLGS